MSRARLTALLMAAGVGAAGLVPASAAPPRPAAAHLDPQQALHAAVLNLPTGGSREVSAWRRAYLSAAAETSASLQGPRERAHVHEIGDVDGDGRTDVAVQREDGTVVRSGRDGRVLVRRDDDLLLPVAAAGAVRLLALGVSYEEQDRGYLMTVRFQGLDRRGRALWTHEEDAAYTGAGAGPAHVGRLQRLPALLELDQRDAAGRPAVLLGALSGNDSPGPVLSQLELSTLSLADGTATALTTVHGSGAGYAYARAVPAPAGAGTCYASTAPVSQVSRVQLACDGDPALWSSVVRLRNPYVADAGDFDGDRLGDLQLSTFGFERPRGAEVLRGTAVLSYADGSSLATSRLDGLAPLRADVDGDGQPDFLELAFEDDGFAVQGVTLAGEVLYRSALGLRESGSLESQLGMDVTGDGVADGYLRAAPRKGAAVAVVVDGRTGRAQRISAVDEMLWPGLRRTGIDLSAVTVDRGRLRMRVLSGDRGRLLLDVRVPGPAGAPAQGGAGTADLDRDGRRDLVVTSRSGDRRLTTAWTSAGRLLWQVGEQAPPPGEELEHVGEAG